MTRHTLPDGTHIDHPAEHVRRRRQRPPLRALRAVGHPGLPCDLQDDLDLEAP